jgi:hypothetical protein
VRTMPSTWPRFALIALLTCACSTTGGTFTQINPPPRALYVRSPQQVEVFSSSPPERPHVDYGVISIEQGEIGPGTPDELLAMLRQMAAQYGCDAVVLAPPSSKSYSRESFRVYSGTCVVYRDTAGASGAAPPGKP